MKNREDFKEKMPCFIDTMDRLREMVVEKRKRERERNDLFLQTQSFNNRNVEFGQLYCSFRFTCFSGAQYRTDDSVHRRIVGILTAGDCESESESDCESDCEIDYESESDFESNYESDCVSDEIDCKANLL